MRTSMFQSAKSIQHQASTSCGVKIASIGYTTLTAVREIRVLNRGMQPTSAHTAQGKINCKRKGGCEPPLHLMDRCV